MRVFYYLEISDRENYTEEKIITYRTKEQATQAIKEITEAGKEIREATFLCELKVNRQQEKEIIEAMEKLLRR